MKLTGPQRSLLKEIVEDGPRTVSDSYAPANKLVLAGLATWRHARYGGGTLEATEAGHALVSNDEAPK